MSDALKLTDGSRISVAIVGAVAEAKDVSPFELTSPLSDVIDPDAIEALFQDRGYNGTVKFDYAGQHVTVDESGQVTVDQPKGNA